MLGKVLRLLPLLIAFIVLFPGQAQALGIGVVPHELELEAYPMGSVADSINVLNPSSEEALYRVYVEGEVGQWFRITPGEFVLEPGSSQVVEVVVSPPVTASGDYHPSICVVSLEHASELKFGCGVKVPVHIRITAPPPLSVIGLNVTGSRLLVVTIVVVSGVVVGVVAWRRRKRRAYEI